MIAVGTIIDRIQKLIDDVSTDTKFSILAFCNEAYRTICEDHVWQTLLSEITFNDTYLPADMERPVLYVEDDQDFTQHEIARSDRYSAGWLYNWYMNGVNETPLVTGSDGVTAINGTTFTSASPSTPFTDDHVGEYIQIGANEGMYEIGRRVSGTEITLTRGFRGADISDVSSPAALTAQYYEVRPRGTPAIVFTDDAGGVISSSTRKVWYQRRPLPLYNDYDQIMLPGSCKAVAIQVHQMMLLGAKYDNDAMKREPAFQRAISNMRPLDLRKGRQPRPRGRFGSMVKYGRSRVTVHEDRNNRRIL